MGPALVSARDAAYLSARPRGRFIVSYEGSVGSDPPTSFSSPNAIDAERSSREARARARLADALGGGGGGRGDALSTNAMFKGHVVALGLPGGERAPDRAEADAGASAADFREPSSSWRCLSGNDGGMCNPACTGSNDWPLSRRI